MTRSEKNKIKCRRTNMIFLLILGVALAVSMFLPFAKVETENNEETQVATYSMVELINYGDNLSPVDDLKMLSGLTPVDEDAEEIVYEGEALNIMSKMDILWGLLVLAIAIIAFAFLKDSYMKLWLYILGSFVLAGAPVYALVSYSNAVDTLDGVVKFGVTGVGFGFPFALGLILLALSGGFIRRISKAFEKTDTKAQKRETVFTIFSLITLVGYFLPLFEIDMKVGLANVRTYWLTATSFFSVIDNVNVSAVYSTFAESQGISFLSFFVIVPVICVVSIILLQLKDKKYARISLWVQSVLAFALPVITLTILKTNVELFSKSDRIVASAGAIVMGFFALATAVYLFMTHSSSQIADRIEHSRKRHNQLYTILLAVTTAVILSPQYGILVKTAKALGLIEGKFHQKIRVPITMFDVTAITGNVFSFVVYAMVIALAVLLISLIAKRYKTARIAAISSGILMLVSYIATYAAIKSYVGDEGVVQVRIAGMLMILLSIAYFFVGFTDKSEKIALTKVNDRTSNIFKYTLLGGFTIVQLYPVIWMFLSSFMTNAEIFAGKVFALPEKWQWRNYSRAIVSTRFEETLNDAVLRVFGEVNNANVFKYIIGATSTGNIIRYFANSLFIVVISVGAIVLFSAMAAYALKRIKWKLSGFMYLVFVLGMMIPVHVALTPLYISFANLHLINKSLSLIIPYIGFGFSIPIIIFYGFMDGIPYEIEEAASIDGAGRIRTFFQLILPMCASAVATVTIFSFLGTWNELMFASLFINEGAKKTITVGVYHMATSQYQRDYGLLFAGLFIASLPTIVFYLLASDQVQKSLTTGSVKG